MNNNNNNGNNLRERDELKREEVKEDEIEGEGEVAMAQIEGGGQGLGGKRKTKSTLDVLMERKEMGEDEVVIAVNNNNNKLAKEPDVSTSYTNRRLGRDYMRWAEGKGNYGNGADLRDPKWSITASEGFIPLQDMLNPDVVFRFFG